MCSKCGTTKERKDRRRVKKNPDQSSAHHSKDRDLGDHRVPVSPQLSPPVERLFYRCRQLQVHKEVLLEGEDKRESVGD